MAHDDAPGFPGHERGKRTPNARQSLFCNPDPEMRADVALLRRGYIAGLKAASAPYSDQDDLLTTMAREAYPIAINRPRIVTVDNLQYRVIDIKGNERVECRKSRYDDPTASPEEGWGPSTYRYEDQHTLEAVVDLIRDPNEKRTE